MKILLEDMFIKFSVSIFWLAKEKTLNKLKKIYFYELQNNCYKHMPLTNDNEYIGEACLKFN